jgi:hypothetical protein
MWIIGYRGNSIDRRGRRGEWEEGRHPCLSEHCCIPRGIDGIDGGHMDMDMDGRSTEIELVSETSTLIPCKTSRSLT